MSTILTMIIIAIIFNNIGILDNIIKKEKNYVKKIKNQSTKSDTKIATKKRNKKNNTTERRSMDK